MTASATLTAGQIRQARTLLRRSSPRIARTACVSFETALRAQKDGTSLALSFIDMRAIRTTLERAGGRFEVDADGRPSAVLAIKP